MSDTKPVVIVTGVGPGTGAAIARRFAHGGYAVAMLARNRDRLTMLEREISGAHAYQCDVTDEAQLDATIEAVRAGLGVPKVLIHNAVGGAFGNFMQIDPEILNRNFQVNTLALLLCGFRADQGGAADFGGIDRARGRTKGRARRLRADRCGYRSGMDAQAMARRSGRILHQARGNRRGNLARRASGSQRLVFQRGDQAVWRNLVDTRRRA